MKEDTKSRFSFKPYRGEWDRKRGTRKKKSFGVYFYWIIALVILIGLSLYAISRLESM